MKIATINEISIGQSTDNLYLVKQKTIVKVLGLIGFIVLTCWLAAATSSAEQVIIFVR